MEIVQHNSTSLGEVLSTTSNRDGYRNGGVTYSFSSHRDNIDAWIEFNTVPGEPLYAHRQDLINELNSRNNQLLDFQVHVIANIVYRPWHIMGKKQVVRTKLQGTPRPRQERFTYMAEVSMNESDLGVTVINDLTSGTGKTIMTILASILFASRRGEEVRQRFEILLREQRTFNWASRISLKSDNYTYENTVVVLTSEQTALQWQKAALRACAILGMRGVNIRRNPSKSVSSFFPLDSDIDITEQQQNEMDIAIFTSGARMTKYFENNTGFVPCVIVDEYVYKAPHNVVTRPREETPIYGRLILVSANATKTAEILTRSRKDSLIRTIMTMPRNYKKDTLRNDVKMSMTLMTCSVLATKERNMTLDYMIHGLRAVPLETFTVQLGVSTWGKFLGTSTNSFHALKNIGLRDPISMVTVGDLKESAELAVAQLNAVSSITATERLTRLCHRIGMFVTTMNTFECPICLHAIPPHEEVCVLGHCYHVFCKQCTSILLEENNDTCPICRSNISGITDLVCSPSPSDAFAVLPREITFEDTFTSYFKNCRTYPNVVYACSAVIASLKATGKESKLLLLSSVPDVLAPLYRNIRSMDNVDIREFPPNSCILRTPRYSSDEQLTWFDSSGSEMSVKVMYISISRVAMESNNENNDALTGIDFSNVDAICSVGPKLNPCQLERIARIPRFFNKGENGHKIVRVFEMII